MHYEQILAYARQLRKDQTEAEKFVWHRLRNRRFQGIKFTRQFILSYKDHKLQSQYFIVDFYCHEYCLVIEIDGIYHEFQLAEDKERDEILRLMGFTIIRFSNEDVLNNWKEVALALKRHIEM